MRYYWELTRSPYVPPDIEAKDDEDAREQVAQYLRDNSEWGDCIILYTEYPDGSFRILE